MVTWQSQISAVGADAGLPMIVNVARWHEAPIGCAVSGRVLVLDKTVAFAGIRRRRCVLGVNGHGLCGAGRADEAATEGQHEGASVLVAEGAVQQEIAGGVDGNKKVEDVAQAEKQSFFVSIAARGLENFVDQRGGCWQLTNEEHHHHGDQSDCDADLVMSCPILTLARLSCHGPAKILTLAHRLYEERVEDDEQRQRQQDKYDAGEPVIDALVSFIVAQVAEHDFWTADIGHRIDGLHQSPFKWCRHRRSEADDVHGHNNTTGP